MRAYRIEWSDGYITDILASSAARAVRFAGQYGLCGVGRDGSTYRGVNVVTICQIDATAFL